jgi:hypothetical protein
MRNGVFFPQAALDEWIVDGSAELQDGQLILLSEGKRYRVGEALRVLREVGGGEDAHQLVGRVKTRAYLEQLGAEIVHGSMLLGELAYDIEPGWLGVPDGTAPPESRHVPGSAGARAAPGGRNNADGT